MPDPTRPVAGAPIDTDWGQQVHDRVFQPKGTRVHCLLGGASSVGATYEQLALDTADDDPGGWLGSDELEVPTGGGGLYAYWLRLNVDGNNGEATRVEIRVNGTGYVSPRFDQDDGVAIIAMAGLIDLSAGDIITVFARASDTTGIRILQLDLLIQGTSIGA